MPILKIMPNLKIMKSTVVKYYYNECIIFDKQILLDFSTFYSL